MAPDEQLAAYLAGDMPEPERVAFEAELLADETSRRELLAQRRISAGLHAMLGTDSQRMTQAILATLRGSGNSAIVRRVAASRPKVVTMPQPRARRPVAESSTHGWWIPLALAAAVAIAALLSWKQLFPTPPAPSATLARVTRAADAVWADSASAPQPGHKLAAGSLRLKSGVVEIEFSRGARAVIEGPADLEITGGNSLRLRGGRLSATVPVAARGFTVETPDTKVVDLGTRFGVVAGAATEVHVFAGKVSVRAASERTLVHNEAVRVSAGKMDAIPAQAQLFSGGARLAGAALAAHPAALVHLDFDGITTNRAAGGITARVIGCQPAEGRWPGQGALAFSQPGDRVRFTVPGEFRTLTLLAWVRVDDIAKTQNALMLSGAEMPGDVHWFLHRDDTLHFSVIGTNGEWRGASAPLPPAKDWLGRWVFLATTFDGAKVAHYFNGQLIGTKQLNGVGALRPGAVELGNWAVRPGTPLRASRSLLDDPTGYPRNLHGSFDEFTLLAEPLAADEIQRLYETGRADAAEARSVSK